ncbi:MAG: hypothetical protein K2N63_05120 [Lachnospiraceae bacterium]|nr:hypothetical protein [Lachnospiraceae bacterium]
MICGDIFYGSQFSKEGFSRGQVKGLSEAEAARSRARLFQEEEEEAAVKHGKQNLIDDARAAGGENGKAMPKTETESRIVVKPDGTKMLVITVRCGQSVRVKSLKISDPDDPVNKQTKQEGERDCPETKPQVVEVKNTELSQPENEQISGMESLASAAAANA